MASEGEGFKLDHEIVLAIAYKLTIRRMLLCPQMFIEHSIKTAQTQSCSVLQNISPNLYSTTIAEHSKVVV